MNVVHLPRVLGLVACVAACSSDSRRALDAGSTVVVLPDAGVDAADDGDAVQDAPMDQAWPDLYPGDRPPPRDVVVLGPPDGSLYAPDGADDFLDEFPTDTPIEWPNVLGLSSVWEKIRDSEQIDRYSLISVPTDGWNIIRSARTFKWNQMILVRLRVIEDPGGNSGSQVMVMGRYHADGDRGMGLAVRGDDMAVARRREGGVVSSYGPGVTVPLQRGQWQVMRLDYVGQDVYLYFHGTYVATLVDDSPPTAQTSVAIGAIGMRIEVDWVKVSSW